ncbi:MAG: hypothetical protein E6K52_04750 [Gammaproteobacteria bacterium]|nr:MAG: hypothetical protein E6K52_04750 [Gammaproteobacteria bacterium]
MGSYSRNSREPSRALRLGLAAVLLSGPVAYAAEQPHAFVLTAFSNGVAGGTILAGDYQSAIKQLAGHVSEPLLEASTANTNRCVAYSMTKQWEAARLACDAAVREARDERANLPGWMEWARKRHDDYVAVAYANRAVMHWFAKDASAAQLDLAKAEALSPKADFVARNLEALRARNALAQVAAGPQS